ncbi:FadR/GntR family transcriptional regulator [uncultured Tessaracoccus sp.]|uniref:FadR/GntR family transcriptional regulator n=1 Tax=uncultured Tessaracoccus sp. TaxID=905023 RepID=UPI0026000199|nr:FadR/GntR family transcriptional regulator [uncultured Tessaracoccus sp.]
MARRALVDGAIEAIMEHIAAGTFVPDEALPPESELANLLDVSRPTMREAVRALTDRGVLHVIHGRGTYVAPQTAWRDLPTLIAMLARTTPPRALGEQLTQVRRMLEVGACGLAAANRDDEDLAALQALLDDYDEAAKRSDLEGIVRCDLAFHERILHASGNPFLAPIMRSLQEALHASRRVTSARAEVRARATEHHHRVLAAIVAQDVPGAKDAMRAHMTQTLEDLIASAQD